MKTFRDGTVSGVCTVSQTKSPVPVICCPNRMYAQDYLILRDAARLAFGANVRLIRSRDVASAAHDGQNVAVFGKRWGGELRLPKRSGSGGYFVDWVLARIGIDGELQEFVALEVQTIDTTGTYRPQWDAIMGHAGSPGKSVGAGLNWENVSKRILPQLIYKGHVLRREHLCSKGLFFVCPQPVYEKIMTRLGELLDYPEPAHGTLTFMSYQMSDSTGPGLPRALVAQSEFTTTVDQLATALSAPRDLPEKGCYETSIRAALLER